MIIAKDFPGAVQLSQGEKRYQDMPDLAFSGKPTFAASSPSCFHFTERQPFALLVSSNPCFEGCFFFFFFKKEQSVWGHPQAVQDAAFTVLQVWHLHGFDSVKVIAAWNLKSWGLRRLGWQIQLPYFRSYCPVAIGTWEVCFSVAWNQSPVL